MSGDIFAARRTRFMTHLGEGVALLSAGTEAVRNRDVEYPFRQDSDFYFLTGFEEPDAVALLDPSAEEPFVLFVRPKDKEMELWTGLRVGVEGAKERFAADEAFPIAGLEEQLRTRLQGKSTLFYRAGGSSGSVVDTVLTRLRAWQVRTGRGVPTEIRDPGVILSELRLRKTEDEVGLLRKACQFSALGHMEAMRFASPGRFEYQVQAALEYVFRSQGSERNGYPSIVASGANACILHYTANDQPLGAEDLLLIDAGAEYGYHSADITRTFPVSGRFTAPQRALYEIVLEAHRVGLAHAEPGATLRGLHERVKVVISEGLIALGLVPKGLDDTLAMHLYREYFMHGTSHWLGMDVHDVGTYGVNGDPRPLETGMAFTVEPGIYVSPGQGPVTFRLLTYDIDEWSERRALLGTESARKLEQEELNEAPVLTHDIPTEFRGIGVRIEDDLLITREGVEYLTASVPTDQEDVEALCKEVSSLGLI